MGCFLTLPSVICITKSHHLNRCTHWSWLTYMQTLLSVHVYVDIWNHTSTKEDAHKQKTCAATSVLVGTVNLICAWKKVMWLTVQPIPLCLYLKKKALEVSTPRDISLGYYWPNFNGFLLFLQPTIHLARVNIESHCPKWKNIHTKRCATVSKFLCTKLWLRH